ncbi:hypothetical protein SYNPS1DRAFT_27725 [Syncephalis pseudoplumigaleata]|uniref:Uncharacterized protein n=1 Tax=Syncephalis pseudoplumigaleata TaxID=1712513 RepID=A0A4P9Z255_9FUNG|nr:hypothetical protein SYNPS1DRAFT_27725 [Syncephalis pseudoplumigaleata]|eukprot:RKP26597.1 hypothetical protein SYNPS1DRAFT_27725 [Syncephalis pseudoplumigaleata]
MNADTATGTSPDALLLRHHFESHVFAADQCSENAQLSTWEKQSRMLQHRLSAYLLAAGEGTRSTVAPEERVAAQAIADTLLRERETLWHRTTRETIAGPTADTLTSRVDDLLASKREKRGFQPILDRIQYSSLDSCRMREKEPTGYLATTLTAYEEKNKRLNRGTTPSSMVGGKDPYAVQQWEDSAPVRFTSRLDPNFFKPRRKDAADGGDRKRTADQMDHSHDDTMEMDRGDDYGRDQSTAAVPRSGFTTAKEQLHGSLLTGMHVQGKDPAKSAAFRASDSTSRADGSHPPSNSVVRQPSMGDGNRALGAKRRPLNPPGSRKFIPPLMNRSGDDTDSRSGTSTNEAVDPRLRNIEPRMIEMIQNEARTTTTIMDQGRPVLEDDIAGLKDAKQTIKEIVVWPMERPCPVVRATWHGENPHWQMDCQ